MIDLSTATKDELYGYTKETFGVELDLTKHLSKLVNEVKKLNHDKGEEPKGSSDVTKLSATHIYNRNTGIILPFTQEGMEYLTNAFPCDKNGNPI